MPCAAVSKRTRAGSWLNQHYRKLSYVSYETQPTNVRAYLLSWQVQEVPSLHGITLCCVCRWDWILLKSAWKSILGQWICLLTTRHWTPWTPVCLYTIRVILTRLCSMTLMVRDRLFTLAVLDKVNCVFVV